jgi:NADH-quinone oxidoreductase subunit N
MIASSLVYLLPELSLGAGGMGLLLYGVFRKQFSVMSSMNAAAILLLFSVGLVLPSSSLTVSLFSGQLVNDVFGQYLKIGILIAAVLVIMSTRKALYTDHVYQAEYPVLILLSVVGMMLMVSSTGYLSLFMGLELQSLSLYIITALKRDDGRASEAGIKYFILGALSSGLFLYGVSLIYGLTGSLLYSDTAKLIALQQGFTLPIYVAFTFILAGVIFKISAVPFHMWTPDVYEGTPTSITTFLATVPKIAAFGMVIRLLMNPFVEGLANWNVIIAVLAMASMTLGSFAALNQKNIKRLIAYSAIGNAGYSLIGMVSGGQSGVQATVIYVFLYVLATICFFACLGNLHRRGIPCEEINDLAGINRIYPGTAFVLAFILFSMAGIPPLAGFLGKLYIFNEAIKAGQITLAVVGVLTSVVSAAYYLWIIKVIMMDPIDHNKWQRVENYKRDITVTIVIILIMLTLSLFFIRPTLFIPFASEAAASLFVK